MGGTLSRLDEALSASVAIDTDNIGEDARTRLAGFHFEKRNAACSLAGAPAAQDNRD